MHINHKDERIKKLWNNGLKDTNKIARKLGLQSEDRVIEGLVRLGIIKSEQDRA